MAPASLASRISCERQACKNRLALALISLPNGFYAFNPKFLFGFLTADGRNWNKKKMEMKEGRHFFQINGNIIDKIIIPLIDHSWIFNGASHDMRL